MHLRTARGLRGTAEAANRVPPVPHRRQDVCDTSGGCGSAFEVKVVSSAFEGKSRLERHRMVMGALEEELKGSIHALALKQLHTPAQAAAAAAK